MSNNNNNNNNNNEELENENSKIRVCVTGGSGFIGSHIVKQLIDETDYIVHCTVRDATKIEEKYKFLSNFVKNDPKKTKRLKFFSGNLLKEDSFDESIKNCDYVLHVASPYTMKFKNPKLDLVDPAVKGTLNVLKSCLKHKIKRVVLTSSIAACMDKPIKNYKFTEKDWNKLSSLKKNPYSFSKVCAEKAAWKFINDPENKKQHNLELIVINPCAVTGPSFNNRINQTVESFVGILNGSFIGKVNLGWCLVDVRDVAKAHIKAINIKLNKNNDNDNDNDKDKDYEYDRFIVGNESHDLSWVCKIIEKNFPKYKSKLPKIDMTGFFGTNLMKVAAYFTQPKGIREYLSDNLQNILQVDNSKFKKEFNFKFIDCEKTIIDTIQSLIDWKNVPKP